MASTCRALVIVGLVSLLLAPGCKNAADKVNKSVADAKATFKPAEPPDPKFLPLANFDDIPIPNNFLVDRKTSFTYVHGTLRVVDLHMSGLTRAEDIARFFESQLEAHGWTVQNRLGETYQRRLDFKKDQESCSVIVSLRDKTTFVDLHVSHR
ncbi:MAG: hypothetical protein HYZ53_08990 [Planctomycetes bacterium]|nr:hypothetical protein [Planctomycetota bacterium]